MLKKENQGIVWFEFEQLQPYPQVRHASFTKKDPQSDSLNLGYTINDQGTSTKHKRNFAFEKIGMPQHVCCMYAKQVHGSAIHRAEHTKIPCDEQYVHGYDAFITQSQNLALCIQHADCQAALFFDSKQGCIANVHSGWQGSVQNIYKQTIDELARTFGSRPEDLLVCISPSLGPQSAEFIHYKTELPSEFYKFQIQPTYFDFWQISRWQLESCGVKPKNIEIASICTYKQDDLFFSYRRTKSSERHVSLIWLE